MLTAVGGGVFGNDLGWIAEATALAVAKFDPAATRIPRAALPWHHHGTPKRHSTTPRTVAAAAAAAATERPPKLPAAANWRLSGAH